MDYFLKRLNPNVVFVTIIAFIVIAAHMGRQEYLDAKRTLVEAQCARQSLYQIGRSDYQMGDIISFGTITSLCIQSGGVDEYFEWVKVGADEKAKTANAPLNTK